MYIILMCSRALILRVYFYHLATDRAWHHIPVALDVFYHLAIGRATLKYPYIHWPHLVGLVPPDIGWIVRIISSMLMDRDAH